MVKQLDILRATIDDIRKEIASHYDRLLEYDQGSELPNRLSSLQKMDARRIDREIEMRIAGHRRELLQNRLKEAEASLAEREAIRRHIEDQVAQLKRSADESRKKQIENARRKGNESVVKGYEEWLTAFENEVRGLNSQMESVSEEVAKEMLEAWFKTEPSPDEENVACLDILEQLEKKYLK